MAAKLIALLGAATSAVASASSELAFGRMLEGDDGSSYTYLDDVSGYNIKYSGCVRVKIPQENDDDANEGNKYFYNGRYHAQYQRFATFSLCTEGKNSCDCDYSVEYATEMGQFLKAYMTYLEAYCAECADDTCTNNCALYNKNHNAAEETDYIDCAEAYQDENGIQYYYAPQCGPDGDVEIGVFYDEECSIKTKNSMAHEFYYYKFQTVSKICVDCSYDDTCGELYAEAYHCLDGKEVGQQQDDYMSVCSTVKKASLSHEFRSRRSGADKFLMGFFVALGICLVTVFFFLTYTYYVRHRANKAAVSLTSQDHDVTAQEGTMAQQATLT